VNPRDARRNSRHHARETTRPPRFRPNSSVMFPIRQNATGKLRAILAGGRCCPTACRQLRWRAARREPAGPSWWKQVSRAPDITGSLSARANVPAPSTSITTSGCPEHGQQAARGTEFMRFEMRPVPWGVPASPENPRPNGFAHLRRAGTIRHSREIPGGIRRGSQGTGDVLGMTGMFGPLLSCPMQRLCSDSLSHDAKTQKSWSPAGTDCPDCRC
jgi:hypothetical protein